MITLLTLLVGLFEKVAGLVKRTDGYKTYIGAAGFALTAPLTLIGGQPIALAGILLAAAITIAGLRHVIQKTLALAIDVKTAAEIPIDPWNEAARSLAASPSPLAGLGLEPVMRIRCKFHCDEFRDVGETAKEVTLSTRYDPDLPEDLRFSKWTPSGTLKVIIDNPAALARLSVGGFYYVDLMPAS